MINDLAKEILYHIDNIDEDGFSNDKIKKLIKELANDIIDLTVNEPKDHNVHPNQLELDL